MMVTKTVSAQFSDFDSAELAARHVKKNFDNVFRIRVGRVPLSSDPEPARPDPDKANPAGDTPAGYLIAASRARPDTAIPKFGPAASDSELAYRNDTLIEALAASDVCDRISAYFTNAGGLHVRIR